MADVPVEARAGIARFGRKLVERNGSLGSRITRTSLQLIA
jgi:hypothetical protein